MNKRYISIFILIFICEILPAGMAKSRIEKCENTKQCSQRSLSLHAKDPGTWKIIKCGPGAVIHFDIKSGAFNAKAYGLSPNKEYCLVRYAGKPPYGDFIARGTSGADGNFNISGTWKNWTGKIWIVLSEDISVAGNSAELKAWHPRSYLFEENELRGE